MYDYEYDNNGNMIVDERKDLQFDYNFLNLLSRAVANSDTTDVKTVYRWLADGTKLGVSDASGDNGYEYLGSLIYRKTPSGTELESTGFRQGRFVNASGGIQIRYHLTDHLGSIRTIIDETGAVVATNDYYTFGKRWDDPQSLNASSNRWLYNGKEIQETGSLDLLDYGARMYDPYTGRWLTQDPLAEVFPWESPFSYAFNNPINLIDMFGLAPKKPDSQQDEIDGDTLPEVVVTAPKTSNWEEWVSLRPELEFAPDIEAVMTGALVWGAENWEPLAAMTRMRLSYVSVLAIPLFLTGDTVNKNDGFSYVVYVMHFLNGVYVGRTAGYGTPKEVLLRRLAVHHAYFLASNPIPLNVTYQAIPVNGPDAKLRFATRGREQQLMDFYGGARSDSNNPKVNSDPPAGALNVIRGVSKSNGNGYNYWESSNQVFGPFWQYTGY